MTLNTSTYILIGEDVWTQSGKGFLKIVIDKNYIKEKLTTLKLKTPLNQKQSGKTSFRLRKKILAVDINYQGIVSRHKTK